MELALQHPEAKAHGLKDPTTRALTFMLVIWLTYSLNGFRPPTQPITLSDENSGSGMRQLIFLSTGATAGALVFFGQRLSELVARRVLDFSVAGLLTLSALWSMMPTLTAKRSVVFILGMFSLSTTVFLYRRPAQGMQRLIFTFGAIAAWISLLGWFGLPRNCVENPARPGLAGVANHPNTIAPYLVIGLVMSWGITAKGLGEVFRRIGQAGLFFAMALTGSMTSIMLFMFCLSVHMVLMTTKAARGAIVFAGLLAAAPIIVIGPSKVKNEALNAMGRDASLSGRDELWAKVFEYAMRNPLLGSGYGAFWTEGKGRELVTTWNPRQAHNAYLDVFADLGLVGIVVVLIVFPLRITTRWMSACGPAWSPQRRSVASLYALCFGMMGSYGLSQSFFFKTDSFPFFAMLWATLILTNTGKNRIEEEFKLPRP